MARKNTRRPRQQKLYKMKGCSKTLRKKHSGGSSGNIYLAYPANNLHFLPNPHLAYTGKGGACGLDAPPVSSMNVNTNGGDKTMPNTGPAAGGFNFLNSARAQRGGKCSCGLPFMTGGCGDTCSATYGMRGGKRRRTRNQRGGNPGIPYPNGLVGSPWTPATSGWPGVDGIQGDRNFLALNRYDTDISRQMVDLGANPPFTGGKKRANTRTKKQRGGNLTNFLTQDLINLGRQVQFGVGSAYNALSGYSAPVNPLPWKDQYKQA